jgi:hypothetical protein
VQLLGGAEHRAAKRMRDHDLVGHFNGEHEAPLMGSDYSASG